MIHLIGYVSHGAEPHLKVMNNWKWKQKTGRRIWKTIQKIEDLNVWKESVRLSVNIYKALKNWKDFRLRDQIQRSDVSIPSNISEGFDRKGNKEFIQLLYIALETGTIDKPIGKDFIDNSKMISAMLYKLIQVRKDKF